MARRAFLLRLLGLVAGLAALRALPGCSRPAARGPAPLDATARPAGEGIASEMEHGVLRLTWWVADSGDWARVHPAQATAVVAVAAVSQRPRLAFLARAAEARGVPLALRGPEREGRWLRYEARVDAVALLGLAGGADHFVHATFLQHRSGVHLLGQAAPS